MSDTSKDFTVAERAILRNQRLIMLGLINLTHRLGHPDAGHQHAMRRRVEDMDRNWEFIANPDERLVSFEQT